MKLFDKMQRDYDSLTPDDVCSFIPDEIDWEDRFYMDERTSAVKQFTDWQKEIKEEKVLDYYIANRILVEVKFDMELQSWQEI